MAGLKQLNWASEGVGATAAALVDLSTVAGNKISNPPWVKFQSAGWVNFPSAPTIEPFTLNVESPREIYADKLVALGLRKYLKARDIWDLQFLANRGYSADYDLVAQKIVDYQQTPEAYIAGLDAAKTRLADPESQKQFAQEMSRFVDAGMLRAFTQNPDSCRMYLDHSKMEIDRLLVNYPGKALETDAGWSTEGPQL